VLSHVKLACLGYVALSAAIDERLVLLKNVVIRVHCTIVVIFSDVLYESTALRLRERGNAQVTHCVLGIT